jgi:hypothetical protein
MLSVLPTRSALSWAEINETGLLVVSNVVPDVLQCPVMGGGQ